MIQEKAASESPVDRAGRSSAPPAGAAGAEYIAGGLPGRPRARLWLVALVFATAAAVALPLTSVGATATPTNVPVSDTQIHSYAGPYLVANPLNSQQLAVSWEDGQSDAACYLGLSSDGGATWHQEIVVGATGLQHFPDPSFNTCFRPSLAYGPDGTLYDAVTTGNATTDAVYLTKSTDQGKSFSAPVAIDTEPLASPPNLGDQEAKIAVDARTGRIYVTWQRIFGTFTTEVVMVASSADQGKTFSSPVQLLPSETAGGPSFASVGPDGRVYVTFQDNTQAAAANFKDPNIPSLVLVSTSTDNGKTFTPPVTAMSGWTCGRQGPNPACPKPRPIVGELGTAFNVGEEIAAAGGAGIAYLADSSLVGIAFHIGFSTTHDGGATWSPPQIIGIPPGLASHDQMLPSLAVAPNGRLDVVYYDLNDTNGIENTYLISSLDGGSTWTTPELLSSIPSDARVGPPSIRLANDPFDGGHLSAAVDAGTDAAWTDTRRGTVANAKEDVFFATTVPSPPATAVQSAQVPVPATGGAMTGQANGAIGVIAVVLGLVGVFSVSARRVRRRAGFLATGVGRDDHGRTQPGRKLP